MARKLRHDPEINAAAAGTCMCRARHAAMTSEVLTICLRTLLQESHRWQGDGLPRLLMPPADVSI